MDKSNEINLQFLGETGRALMKGFTEVCPLLDSEWDLLLDATLCRTLQHQIACLVASVEHPENSSYLLATYDVEWSIFDRLLSEEGPELLKFWRSLIAIKVNKMLKIIQTEFKKNFKKNKSSFP